MRSSTSSSDAEPRPSRGSDWAHLASDATTHVPGGGWGRAWVLALGIVMAGLAGIEYVYRHAGIRGSVVDDLDLWSYQRSRVHGPPGSVVALLGSSQMQLGFATGWFRQHMPQRKSVQLAVDGTHPFATLRDLAEDPDFRGIVIVDISVWGLSRGARESQSEFAHHYHHASSLNRRLNRATSAWLEERLALRAPGVDLLRVLRTGNLPAPFYVVTKADRSRQADYTMIDIAPHRAERVRQTREAHLGPPIPADRWINEALAAEPLVHRIQERGGKVAFVVFPSTGESRRIFESAYPRSLYWDRFAERTRAVTLHFLDVPELANLPCPDTIHLDQRDTGRFTAVLIRELERRGVFAARNASLAPSHSTATLTPAAAPPADPPASPAAPARASR